MENTNANADALLNLADRLSMLCWMAAQAIQDAGDLTIWHVENYIPGHVFSLAVYCGCIPEPDETDQAGTVLLGDFLVEETARDEFLDSLSIPLGQLAEIASDHAGTEVLEGENWERPTPRDRIDEYRFKNGLMSYERMAEEGRKFISFASAHISREPLSARTIRRLRNEPGHHPRHAIVEALSKLMDIDRVDLFWRKKT